MPCIKLAKRAKTAIKAAETLPEAGEKARKLKSQADNLKLKLNPKGSDPAGRSLRVGDGESQAHKERQPVLSLLDGYREREREGAERAY